MAKPPVTPPSISVVETVVDMRHGDAELSDTYSCTYFRLSAENVNLIEQNRLVEYWDI